MLRGSCHGMGRRALVRGLRLLGVFGLTMAGTLRLTINLAPPADGKRRRG